MLNDDHVFIPLCLGATLLEVVCFPFFYLYIWAFLTLWKF